MKQQAARDMNEEKEAAARKEIGGFNHPIYAITAKRVAHLRPHPAPPIVREVVPKFTVEVLANGQTPVVGEVVIGIPGKVEVPCPDALPHCEVAHLASESAPAPERIAEPVTFVEAERFIDARAFGCRILGCSEVDIARLEVANGHRPFPRWQIRFTGSAGGATPLAMQARWLNHAFEFADDDRGWSDVRKL